jgi:dihydrofolate reductase
MSRVSAVAAIGRKRELGKEGKLLWHIPDDLRRFKALTLGHPVVMGRKTFESIVGYLGGPLPGRINVVISRNPEYKGPSSGEVVWAGSVEEALKKAKEAPGGEEVFIGGGAQIYEAALPFTDRLCLTLVDDEREADSYFPPYEEVFTKITADEKREWKGLSYRWVDVERE